MATIYLIRHGQASFGSDDYDQLSETGVLQASCLGQSLKTKMSKPDLVITGSMKRHQDTAMHSMKAFGDVEQTTFQQDNCWNEYAHQEILGLYDERFTTPAQMKAILSASANPEIEFLEIFNAAVARWMGGQHDADYSETWEVFKTRLHSGLSKVVESIQDKQKILVFTSGGPISLLAQSYLGVPEERLMQMNWTLVNCGITKLVTSRHGVFVASLNEHTVFEQAENKGLLTYK